MTICCTIRSGLAVAVVAAVLGVCRSDTLAPADFLSTHHWGEVDVTGDRRYVPASRRRPKPKDGE